MDVSSKISILVVEGTPKAAQDLLQALSVPGCRVSVAAAPAAAALRALAEARPGATLAHVIESVLQDAAAGRESLRPSPGQKARAHELEARIAALEARLREIAGLVADPAGEAANIDPGLEQRLRGLSRREIEIVRLLAEGRRVAAISRDLDLSIHTVRNHLRAIFRKVHVHSQEELLDAVRGLPPGTFVSQR